MDGSRMSKQIPELTPELIEWISAQRIFFVASAPLSGEGHVNCSPKGSDCFRVFGPLAVGYADYTGSGAETAAHLHENGRVIIMFCAFAGPPRILRLHGRGEVIHRRHLDFERWAESFPPNPGLRSIVRIQVTRVSTSCGYSIPFFDYQGPRDTLDKWAATKSPEDLQEYRKLKNRKSIDGLPAFEVP